MSSNATPFSVMYVLYYTIHNDFWQAIFLSCRAIYFCRTRDIPAQLPHQLRKAIVMDIMEC